MGEIIRKRQYPDFVPNELNENEQFIIFASRKPTNLQFVGS